MSLDDGYVTSDYLKRVAEAMRAFKNLSYEHMAITPGDTVLDLGCGPGVDTVPLAARAGDGGKVIGIDSDAKMLAEADQAAVAASCRDRIEHRLGSAMAIPLEAGAVAASRAERLLQVLPPARERTVLAELVRVTRRGGRIVLADTDWGSASVELSDVQLERRLMTFFAVRMRPNGLAGRRLHWLCREQGLEDVRLDVVPMVQQRLDDAPFGTWLTDAAKREGVVDEAQAALWREELQRREQEGRFYSCANMVIASGRV